MRNTIFRSSDIPDKLPESNSSTDRNFYGLLRGLKRLKDDYDTAVKTKAKAYANSVLRGKTYETDDELLQKAKDATEPAYLEKTQKAENKRAKELGTLGTRKTESLEAYQKQAEDIAAAFDALDRKNMQSLSKKNMTNSSVRELTESKNREDRAAQLAYADEKLGNRLQAIEEKIDEANTAYQTALQSYEINYALALEERLRKLKNQREKLMQSDEKEAEKHFGEKMSEYYDQYERENREFEKTFNAYADDKKENYDQRLAYAVEEANKLSAKDKKRLIAEKGEYLRDYLGLYYDRFLKEIG